MNLYQSVVVSGIITFLISIIVDESIGYFLQVFKIGVLVISDL